MGRILVRPTDLIQAADPGQEQSRHIRIDDRHDDRLLLIQETSELEQLRNSVGADLVLEWRPALDGLPQARARAREDRRPYDHRSNS